MMASDAEATESGSLTYVEFYSGIGGWSMALEEATQRLNGSRVLKRLAALDHSDLCRRVFSHNFEPIPPTSKRKKQAHHPSIERLTIQQVEEWAADLWLMSPPCQPHTRQHENQNEDLQDARSQSFLNLVELLDRMTNHPSIIVLENVVGFEKSGSCRLYLETLAKKNYRVQNFHINPTQVAIPNDRPRFYSVAIREDRLRPQSTDQAWHTGNGADEIVTQLVSHGICPAEDVSELPPIASFLDDDEHEGGSLLIPPKLLQNKTAAWCFDIVTPSCTRSACFTQAYGKFVRGTGSILYTGPLNQSHNEILLQKPSERTFNAQWMESLDTTQLRYFSGSELSRLLSFRSDFSFPCDLTNKQQFKLLGNSINVRVASRLLEFALSNSGKIGKQQEGGTGADSSPTK